MADFKQTRRLRSISLGFPKRPGNHFFFQKPLGDLQGVSRCRLRHRAEITRQPHPLRQVFRPQGLIFRQHHGPFDDIFKYLRTLPGQGYFNRQASAPDEKALMFFCNF